MEPADSSSPPRATEKKNSMPSSAGESETWFEDFKRKTMNLKVEESFSKIAEITSDILVFSRQMDEYEKATDLKEKLFMERLAELKKKEEIVREREMNVEMSEKELEEKRNFLLSKEKELEKEVEAKRNFLLFKEKEFEKEVEDKRNFLLFKEKELEKEVEKKRNFLLFKEKELEKEVEEKRNFLLFKEKELEKEVGEKRNIMELKEKELEEREKKVEIREREVRDEVHTSEPETREAVEIICIDETDEDDDEDDDDEPFTCPDPDFNDFNNTMSSFAVGQVWALYDPLDGMPRYYAQIKRILKSEQSLRVRWLESENKEPTPVACGRFKYGKSKMSGNKSNLMFSHEMSRITRGKTVTIFPRKGETWALYRDWNPTWNCDVDQHLPPYNYDFVEVLFEFDIDVGIGVAYLGRVEGFTSVYKHDVQHGVLQMMIPSDEMLRFSHRVPSFKMNGDEKEGVPAGSFELDPAAIPRAYLKATKVEEITD